MRKNVFAVAAVSAMASSGAWAGKHHPMTESEQENCLMTDTDEAGETWCVKSGAGMSKKQIDAFYRAEGKTLAQYAPGYKNCLREAEDAKRLGEWYGKPGAGECRTFAAHAQAANGTGPHTGLLCG